MELVRKLWLRASVTEAGDYERCAACILLQICGYTKPKPPAELELRNLVCLMLAQIRADAIAEARIACQRGRTAACA